jgi:integrase/recombinase XerD
MRLVGLLARWLAEGNGPTDLRRIRHEHVAAFLVSSVVLRTREGRPRKASSANTLRTALRQFGRWLVDAGYTAQNPFRLVRLARTSPAPPRSLSDEDVDRLLSAIETSEDPLAKRDGVLVRLLLGTGLRLCSALAVRVEDLDLRHGDIRVRRAKNDAPIVLPLSREVVRLLRAHVHSGITDWLFMGRHGQALTTRQAGSRIRRWAQAAGLEGQATAHALRHSHAQRLYDRTRDIALVRAALGHRCLSSAAIYARTDNRTLRAALRGSSSGK